MTIFICADGFFESSDNRGDDDDLTFGVLVVIMNRNPGAVADTFIIGAFIGSLKSAPPADIVQEDG